MNMYQRILVAVDVSPEAEQVMRKASQLAEMNHARVDVIHVVEPVVVETTFDVTPMIDTELEDNLIKRAQAFIDQQVAELGMTIDEVLIPVGSTKAEIHNAATERGSDLIVLGTHGRHGVSLFLGSTANAVLHGTECDVLAVRIKENQ